MLNTNHPDDELLSALASHDTDATADASLTDHVASCTRCTALVDEFGALRAILAELPDLRPNRPLRLLPDVAADSSADRVGGWARRVFGPVLAAGAALALVGMVGTAAPNFSGMASGPGPASEQVDQASESVEADHASGSLGAVAEPGAEAAPESSHRQLDRATASWGSASAVPDRVNSFYGEDSAGEESDGQTADRSAAERSPWPMVLFSGVALMIAAGLLRWILVPRAG